MLWVRPGMGGDLGKLRKLLASEMYLHMAVKGKKRPSMSMLTRPEQGGAAPLYIPRDLTLSCRGWLV